MSFGLHHIWKRQLISMIEPYKNHTLLDVAGGTGDIAMGFLNNGGGTAIICDINENMLQAGKQQRINNGTFNKYKDKLSTICADVQKLPFENNSFEKTLGVQVSLLLVTFRLTGDKNSLFCKMKFFFSTSFEVLNDSLSRNVCVEIFISLTGKKTIRDQTRLSATVLNASSFSAFKCVFSTF
jgi:hypothetical protein